MADQNKKIFDRSVTQHNKKVKKELDEMLSRCYSSNVPSPIIPTIQPTSSSSNKKYPDLTPEENLHIDTEQTETELTFSQKLAAIIIENNLTVKCTNQLLRLLKDSGLLDLPLTRRTLIETPLEKINTDIVEPGQYYHFGIQEVLGQFSSDCFLKDLNKVELDINVDGTPLTKSSTLCMWPILGAFANIDEISPFIIGVYVGKKQPDDFNIYLKKFVEECVKLYEEGIFVTKSKILKSFSIRLFICDAPARNKLTCTFGHGSLNGCPICTQVGNKTKGVVVYKPTVETLRTDESFRLRKHDIHHVKNGSIIKPILESIPNLDMVKQFIIDPMHAIDLGVSKKIINYIFYNKSSTHLSIIGRNNLDSKYISLAAHMPSEFTRRPRSLTELSYWKSSEFHTFLLYTGIVCLKKTLSPDMYEHFLYLFSAVRLLSSKEHYISNVELSQELLNHFVENFKIYYGETSLTFNVHSLLHFPDMVQSNGPLMSFSAYKFENFLFKLKNKIKGGRHTLTQIRNRMKEQVNIFSKLPKSKSTKGKLASKYNSYERPEEVLYKSYSWNQFYLEQNIKDNCILDNNNSPFLIEAIKENVCVARKYEKIEPFFDSPISSLSLNIMKVSILATETTEISFEKIKCKMVRLPFEEYFILIPLLHTC